MKRMSSSELRTAISGMKHTEVIYEDDLSNPMLISNTFVFDEKLNG